MQRLSAKPMSDAKLVKRHKSADLSVTCVQIRVGVSKNDREGEQQTA